MRENLVCVIFWLVYTVTLTFFLYISIAIYYNDKYIHYTLVLTHI